MEAIIQADVLADWLDLLDPLVEEARIGVTEGGFSTNAVEPANVGLIDTDLHQLAFESLQVDGDGFTLGIPLDRLEETIDLMDSDTLVRIAYDHETKKLSVEGEGLHRSIALIDPDLIRDSPELPDLDIPAEASVDVDELDRAVGAADLVSDHIGLEWDDDVETVVIDAEGDTDDMRYEVDSGALERPDETLRSLFSLDYFDPIIGAIPSGTDVRIRFGGEIPVKLSFNVEDGQRDGLVSETTYMIAPRIQSN